MPKPGVIAPVPLHEILERREPAERIEDALAHRGAVEEHRATEILHERQREAVLDARLHERRAAERAAA